MNLYLVENLWAHPFVEAYTETINYNGQLSTAELIDYSTSFQRRDKPFLVFGEMCHNGPKSAVGSLIYKCTWPYARA